MNQTLRLCVILAAALLWSSDAQAYQLRALENSFLGTNSTTAPFINWSRHREDNGSASIEITSNGQEGFVVGSISLQRVSSGLPSTASATYNFTAQLEENVKPLTPTSEGDIIRLTMTVSCSGSAFRTPPPIGNTGNAFVNLDTRLGVYSARMIGTSRRGIIGGWESTTNVDSGAVESTFDVHGGLIAGLTYAYRRGSGTEPNYYFAVQVSGEATAGTFDAAQAIAQASARVNFMMEISTDNGVNYSVVPWTSINGAFLDALRPQLSLAHLNLSNHQIGIVALPLSQRQLQAAPTPTGPWTNFGPAFVIPNLQPVIITDSEAATTRFFQAIKP